MAASKVQTEIPGAERPRIDTLDEILAPFLEKRDLAKRARNAEKDLRAQALDAMRRIADKLEEDEHGNPTYTYQDGERTVALSLVASTKLSVRIIDDEAAGADDGAEGDIG